MAWDVFDGGWPGSQGLGDLVANLSLGRMDPMEVRKVAVGTWSELAGGVWALVSGVNAGVIVSEGEALVVDTLRSPADAAGITEHLAHSDPGAQVKWVVNTHSHWDHTFGNQVFEAPVVAQRKVYESMRANLAGPWSPSGLAEIRRQLPEGHRLDGVRVVLPEVIFYDQLDLAVGRRLARLAHFGGHTPGSSIVFLEDEGIVFSGDDLFVGRYPFMHQASVEDWQAAIRELLAMKPKIVVPGHGPILTGEHISREIDRLSRYFEETVEGVEKLMAEGRSKEEALDSPVFPKYQEEGYERLHRANIGRVWDELAARKR